MTGEDKNTKNEEFDTQVLGRIVRKPVHPMEMLLKQVSPVALLKVGDIIEGTVIEKRGANMFVDLGARGVGVVYGREYYAAQDIIKQVKPGDVLSAKIVEVENDEGYVELSLKDAGEDRKWVDLKKHMTEGTILELPVLEANRGGLIFELEGVKGFMPVSQLSSKNYPRVEGGDKERILEELQKFVGMSLRVRVLDAEPKEDKLIFTEADKVMDQETTRQALAKYKIGDTVGGVITGVVDFGAFMKFDEAGLEGLIHISEIDWTLVENPRDVLKPGDEVQAKIIDIQGYKISLSLKALKENPWEKIAEKYKKGDVVRGKVSKYNPFGSFVELDGEIQGLVHISEFGSEQHMRDAIEIGKVYDFKVLLIDPKEHRMSLGVIRPEGDGSEEAAREVPEEKKEVSPAE